MDELAKTFGCRLLNTLVYGPRSNCVERKNADLHRVMTKCLENHADWPLMFATVEHAVNTSVSKTTGYTPNEIFFGRKLPSVMEQLSCFPSQISNSYGDFMTETVERMRVVYDQVTRNLRLVAETNESTYHRLRHNQTYEVGQTVLLFIPRVGLRNTPKWTRYYGNKAVIIERKSPTLYVVGRENSRKTILVHSIDYGQFRPSSVKRL
jgi:hypothetical protein